MRVYISINCPDYRYSPEQIIYIYCKIIRILHIPEQFNVLHRLVCAWNYCGNEISNALQSDEKGTHRLMFVFKWCKNKVKSTNTAHTSGTTERINDHFVAL